MPDPSLIVGGEGRRRRLRRVERAAVVELQAIASHLDAPLDVRTREVHIWVDARASTQAWLRAAGAKREEASRRLLEYPSTPALAGWLSDLGWGRGAVRSAPTGRGTLELPGFHTQGDTLDEAIATSKKH
jgi:hypothetical protein